ncbi:unnamed protein product, partial [Rotaria sp. Silwood2]
MYLGWTTTGSMNYAREWHTASVLTSGKVLVTGGFCAGGASCLNSSELYDPSTGSWTIVNGMNYARNMHTALVLTSGQVLVTGGLSESSRLTSAELYDPTTGIWTNTGH